jgi:6,7-dimethyl-8-ribityllumazine synthase
MQIKNKTYTYLNGKKLKACVVVARWNSDVTDKLLQSALEALEKSGVHKKNIRVISVAGSVEIPFALNKMAKTKKYDFLVSLGCIIKGDTFHFDYVCKMVQEGVLKVSIENNIPIGFGVLMLKSVDQAKDRIHVGKEATLAALELALIS